MSTQIAVVQWLLRVNLGALIVYATSRTYTLCIRENFTPFLPLCIKGEFTPWLSLCTYSSGQKKVPVPFQNYERNTLYSNKDTATEPRNFVGQPQVQDKTHTKSIENNTICTVS